MKKRRPLRREREDLQRRPTRARFTTRVKRFWRDCSADDEKISRWQIYGRWMLNSAAEDEFARIWRPVWNSRQKGLKMRWVSWILHDSLYKVKKNISKWRKTIGIRLWLVHNAKSFLWHSFHDLLEFFYKNLKRSSKILYSAVWWPEAEAEPSNVYNNTSWCRPER